MSGAAPSFDQVWERIVAEERKFFRTRKGEWFTYRIEGDCLLPSHSDLRIGRSDFERAYPLLPVPGPGKLARVVEGASYLWAILHDERISGGAW